MAIHIAANKYVIKTPVHSSKVLPSITMSMDWILLCGISMDMRHFLQSAKFPGSPVTFAEQCRHGTVTFRMICSATTQNQDFASPLDCPLEPASLGHWSVLLMSPNDNKDL